MSNAPFQVLLVEDHPADIALTRKAFGRITTPNNLHVALNGWEAMHFLRKEGRFREAPRPDIILLDLNMPRMNGKEVLVEIEKVPLLRCIPVIILTTSSAPVDVNSSYTLCANSYLVKPVKYADFLEMVKVIERYWFQTALIPRVVLPPGP